jgi:TolA-binding protein
MFLGTHPNGQIEQALRQGAPPAVIAQQYGNTNVPQGQSINPAMITQMQQQQRQAQQQMQQMQQQQQYQYQTNSMQYQPQAQQQQPQQYAPGLGQFQQPQMPASASDLVSQYRNPNASLPFQLQPQAPAGTAPATTPFAQHSSSSIATATDLKSPFYTPSAVGAGGAGGQGGSANLAFCNLNNGSSGRKLQSHPFESATAGGGGANGGTGGSGGYGPVGQETSMSRLGSAYMSQKEQDAMRAQQNMTPQQYQQIQQQAQMNQQFQQIQQQVQGIPPHLLKQMNLPFQPSN